MNKEIVKRPVLKQLSACIASLLLSAVVVQGAQAAFQPEAVTVKPTIDPGPNVFVNALSLGGPSHVRVFGQDKLDYRNDMTAGNFSQLALSKDGKTAYIVSAFFKRYSYGPKESVIQVYDVPTGKILKEIIVPDKSAESMGYPNLIALSADGTQLYVQNATPATSVTAVDIASGKVLSEIPTPGCYAINPAPTGHQFSTPCGTGQFKTVKVDGDQYSSKMSDKIFDVDTSPIYIASLRRANGDLILTSFSGKLLLADDSGDTVSVRETLDVTKGVDGNWAPGGYQVAAYNAANDVVFLLMHPDATEGSHKDGSREIWAYSLKEKKLLSRSPAEGLVGIDSTSGESPVLFAVNEDEGVLEQFRLDDPVAFTFAETGSDAHAGWATNLVVGP